MNIKQKILERLLKLDDKHLVELLKTGDKIILQTTWDDGELCGHNSISIHLTKK